MYLIKLGGDFLLSTWLWGMTFDRIHLLITSIIMIILLKFVAKKTFLRATIVSLSANLISFGIFTLIVVFGLMYLLNWQYTSIPEPLLPFDIAFPCIALGIVHACLQIMFFTLLKKFFHKNVLTYVIIVLLSNSIATVISYLHIRTMFI